MAFHATYVWDVPNIAQKRLKLAIFGFFQNFLGQKTIVIISIVTNMCKFYVWALNEAFGGDWEQYTYSKYKKTAIKRQNWQKNAFLEIKMRL